MMESDPWNRGCIAGWSVPALLLILLLAGFARADVLPHALEQVRKEYVTCRSNYLAQPGQIEKAVKLATACFQVADLTPDDQERSTIADQGIAAARAAIESDSGNAAAHYYLGLNLGALARTKKLGALTLLKQMERALLFAAEHDARIDYAGPDRALGQLYLEAPGWPTSVGSKKKAREHLSRAVQLEPGYPDNRLSLMEAYVRWKEPEPLKGAMREYEAIVSAARKSYSGSAWDQAWNDWDERWRHIQREFQEL